MLGECLLISSLPGKALRTLVDIARLAKIHRILDECLLISSVPDNALRTLFDIGRLAEMSTRVLKAETSKLYIKRREPGILFISLSIVAFFKLGL